MRSSEPLFRVPPFPAFPSLSRYVAVGSIQDAMTRVCRSIDAREGISLVIGPPGTGKSLLANLIEQAYRETREVVVLGEAPLADPAALGRHLLHHLGIARGGDGASDWQLTLADHLNGADSSEGGLLILLDEAQALSAEVLEAIRMTTNIMRRGEPRVSAVLCGGPRLDETLADPALEPLTQRVATRCYLHPLSYDESRHYITEAIHSCGADPGETICDEAITAVYHACSGVPRLINQLMTQAIDCAEASNQSVISEAVVERAWAQLQQLPSPMIEEPALAEPSAPIEFGTLDDPAERDGAAEPVAEAWIEPASEPEQPHQPPASVAQLDCDVSLPSVLFPEELFGQFDEEEEVIVGAGVPPQSGAPETDAPAEAPLGPPAGAPLDAPAEPLESSLHQEIIGIASQAAQAAGEPSADLARPHQRGEAAADPPRPSLPYPGETAEDRWDHDAVQPKAAAPIADTTEATDTTKATGSTEADVEPAPRSAPQPAIWLTESDDGGLVCDDRDLLVIEDEVELERGSEPAASLEQDDQEAPVAVDFQAMLERMRSGS